MGAVRARKQWKKWVHSTIRNAFLVYGPKLDTVFLNSQHCVGTFPALDLTQMDVYNPTYLFKSVHFEFLTERAPKQY